MAGHYPSANHFTDETTLELARKIPALVLQGNAVAALARCEALIPALERNPNCAPLKTKILRLRHLLERELPTSDDLKLPS
jgi:hypothetical protein